MRLPTIPLKLKSNKDSNRRKITGQSYKHRCKNHKLNIKRINFTTKKNFLSQKYFYIKNFTAYVSLCIKKLNSTPIHNLKHLSALVYTNVKC